MASSLPHPRRIVASNLPIEASGSDTFAEPAVEIIDETLTPVSLFGGTINKVPVATNAILPAINDGQ